MREAYQTAHDGDENFAVFLSRPPAAAEAPPPPSPESVASFHTAHSHSLNKLEGRRSIANEGNIRRDQIYFG